MTKIVNSILLVAIGVLVLYGGSCRHSSTRPAKAHDTKGY